MLEQEAQVSFLSSLLVTLDGEASSAKGEGPLPITLEPIESCKAWGIISKDLGCPPPPMQSCVACTTSLF